MKFTNYRIAKIVGGVSTIKVGAVTESELREKIDRVDDAVCAVASAKELGIVAGGGIALMNASMCVPLDSITEKSIKEPFNKILKNAGIEYVGKKYYWWDIFKWFPIGNDICYHNYPYGYNVKTFQEVNMIEEGVIDSAKVIVSALTNAVSVANTILMVDNCITLKRQEI